MKKIISIILALALVLPCFNMVTFATDFDGHWAESAIRRLITENVISGDQFGNINPDNNISRAEYIKVINKTFGYRNLTGINFKDVDASKWYYNDLLIAKNAGYITGDEMGNANPESVITRAEVAVILTRILKLSLNYNVSRFTDSADIPSWATGYIGALTNEGYISGYADNSFRAENNMTRAEAFSLVSRIMDDEDSAGSGSISTGNIVTPGGSSNNSSNDSSGDGDSSSTVAEPVIRQYNNEEIIIDTVSNVASYKVLLKSAEKEIEYEFKSGDIKDLGNGTLSISIKDKIADFKDKSSFGNFTLQVFVKAVADEDESPYTDATSFSVNLPCISEPDAIWGIKKFDGVEKVFVKWTEDSDTKDHTLKLTVNGEEKEIAVDNDNNIATFPIDTLKDYDGEVTIVANSNNPALKNPDVVTLYPTLKPMPGSGTEEDPYIIRTVEDYDLITDLTAVYVFVSDLDLSNSKMLGAADVPFTGKIIGKKDYENNKKAELRLNINTETEEYTEYTKGFVRYLKGTVENIIINGRVKGASVVGAIAGTNEGTIKNCINKAEIVALSSQIGGIAGVNKGTIENCGNAGRITAINMQFIGGITGENNGIIRKCFNSGVIETRAYVGGISHSYYASDYYEVSDCYNSGILKIADTGSFISYTNADVLNEVVIKNNYTVGKQKGVSNNIHNILESNSIPALTIANNYFCFEETGINNAKEFNVTAIAKSNFGKLESFVGFSSDVWEIVPSSDYKYPQLKGNPHVDNMIKLYTPDKGKIENKILTFAVDSRELNHEVKVEKDGQVQYNKTTTDTEIDLSSILDYNGDYKVTVKSYSAHADSHIDSDSYTFTYTLTDGKEPLKAISDIKVTYDSTNDKYVVSWADDGEVYYNIEVSNDSGKHIEENNVLTNSFEIVTGVEFDGNDTYTFKVTGYNSEDVDVSYGDIQLDTRYGGGEGTEEKPYEIYTIRHLNNIDLVGAKYYIQKKDIADNITTPFNSFKGVYDGNYNEINLNISDSNGEKLGLFKELSGTVKNLVIKGQVSGKTYVGSVAGTINEGGYVSNVMNYAKITSAKEWVGGIASESKGTVEYCINYGDITSETAGYLGGIVGDSYGVVDSCGNEGNVSGNSVFVGGVVGFNHNKVTKSYNHGNVKSNTYLGGIVGYNAGVDLEISDCYNAGTIEFSSDSAGGISYSNEATGNIIIKNNYNIGVMDRTAGESAWNSNVFQTWSKGASGTAEVLNNYYCQEFTGWNDRSDVAVGTDGNKPVNLSLTDVKDLSKYVGFSEDVWEIDTESGYLYPQLKWTKTLKAKFTK